MYWWVSKILQSWSYKRRFCRDGECWFNSHDIVSFCVAMQLREKTVFLARCLQIQLRRCVLLLLRLERTLRLFKGSCKTRWMQARDANKICRWAFARYQRESCWRRLEMRFPSSVVHKTSSAVPSLVWAAHKTLHISDIKMQEQSLLIKEGNLVLLENRPNECSNIWKS